MQRIEAQRKAQDIALAEAMAAAARASEEAAAAAAKASAADAIREAIEAAEKDQFKRKAQKLKVITWEGRRVGEEGNRSGCQPGDVETTGWGGKEGMDHVVLVVESKSEAVGQLLGSLGIRLPHIMCSSSVCQRGKSRSTLKPGNHHSR